MKADYDSEGDTVQIELEPFDRLDYGDDETHDTVVVGIRHDRPVAVDIIGTTSFEEPLRVAAERFDLDAEALVAAAQAAIAAPDRMVTMDVGVRIAA